MRTTLLKIAICASVIVWIGCSKDVSDLPGVHSLSFLQEDSSDPVCASVVNRDYELCILEVDEDRCPIDVFCIWEGNAKVNFQLRVNSEITDFSLNTNDKFPTDTVISNLRIALNDVLPYPNYSIARNHNQHTIEFTITSE